MTDRQTRLRTARVAAGFLSARSAAQRFGWSPSTYAAHENGQNDFNDEAAMRYAKAFRVKPSWLYLGLQNSDEDFVYTSHIYGEIDREGVVNILRESDPDRQLDIETGVKIDKSSKLFYFQFDSFFPKYQSREVLVTQDHILDGDINIGFRDDCVCYLEDGTVCLRRPEPTNDFGVYSLHIFNSPNTVTAKLVKVGLIIAVLKRRAMRTYRPGADDLSSWERG